MNTYTFTLRFVSKPDYSWQTNIRAHTKYGADKKFRKLMGEAKIKSETYEIVDVMKTKRSVETAFIPYSE